MVQRKKRQIKTYAFIDTNIFLDFYRAQNETNLSLLKKLESVSERVICTYQVEMEFLKNRQRVIMGISNDTTLDINANLPAVMDDTQLSNALKKEKKELQKKRKQLKKRLEKIISNPSSYDPIYKSLESIFGSNNEHVLTRDMKVRHKIKRLAWRRFMLGYPPRKSGDTSIGDALNWEWLIHTSKSLSGKFVIVSRDSDFGNEYNGQYFLNDALRKEFRDRVGRKSIKYTHKLSEALKELEVKITPAEEESEAAQLSRKKLANASLLRDWSDSGGITELLRQNNEASQLFQSSRLLDKEVSYRNALEDVLSGRNFTLKGLKAQDTLEKLLRKLDDPD